MLEIALGILPVVRSLLSRCQPQFFYDKFCTLVKTQFDLHFPKKTRQNQQENSSNQQVHKLWPSQEAKKSLNKRSLKNPSAANIHSYKTYRNTYNATLRRSKISFFQFKLEKTKSNP